MGFGLFTMVLFSFVGALVAAYGIYSWVQELRNAEPH